MYIAIMPWLLGILYGYLVQLILVQGIHHFGPTDNYLDRSKWSKWIWSKEYTNPG